jgi:EAL domain-containing protein (putative c-di-GMP-specific phosphodiesterase class I)
MGGGDVDCIYVRVVQQSLVAAMTLSVHRRKNFSKLCSTRLGPATDGDEFVVIMPKIENHGSISTVANRLLQVLSDSFSVGDRDHFVGASIGVVVFPDDGDSVETLLKNADSAMYRAKESGRSRFEFFSEELNVESRRKINLERDLRNAYLKNDLQVHYQPQFDLSTGVISGAEALLRWQHPEHGYVSPAEFVPLAEESDLIIDIGQWVIERAVHDLHGILELGLHPGPVAINVSARQLRDTDFPQQVLEPLQRYNVHPGFLELEITETTVARNRDTAVDILNVLREASVKVAIDDFGTGYSSLSYLQHMPFDIIKIDKSFIDLIGTGDRGESICRTIIRMAHELGKEAVAEGVETREQADFLLSNNCDYVQGYFYSKALERTAFIEFIEKQDFHTQRRKKLELI